MAQRDELERQMQTLIRDAENRLQNTSEPDAQEIYDLMVDLYERLGNPPEEGNPIIQG